MLCTDPTIERIPYPDGERYRVKTGIVMRENPRRSTFPRM
jgi:hypothetical protein